MKSHDADLCERIRVLEDRVRELEAQPRTIVYPSYPYWPYTAWPPNTSPWWVSSPTITYDTWVSNTSATTGQISTSTLGVPSAFVSTLGVSD